MSERAMPTRGPATVRDATTTDAASVCDKHGVPIVDMRGDGFVNYEQENATARLLAAAINASNAAADMGFDPIAAVEALPKLLEALRNIAGLDYTEAATNMAALDAVAIAASALSSARARQEVTP